MNEFQRTLYAAISVSIIGFFIGIGKLLQSRVKITWRLMIGRGITTGALAMASFSVLAWMPDVSLVAIVGIGALIASIGESAIENIINSYVSKKTGESE